MKKIDKAYIIRHIVRYANRKQTEEERWYVYNDCVRAFRKRLEKNNIPVDEPAPGEDEHIKFWQQFCERVEPYSYRYYHRLCGENPHIIPGDIACCFIEPILNPRKYVPVLSDKNMYARLFPVEPVYPKYLIYRQSGGVMYVGIPGSYNNIVLSGTSSAEEIFNLLSPKCGKIVLKPSIDSHSGRGVMLFESDGAKFINSSGTILTGSFLLNYGNDFVIQEAVTQHPFFDQFCKSSVNTMRVITYRSVSDDSITVIGAVLRIGHEGSVVDNLFAGGGFVTIDISDGTLGKRVYDQYNAPKSSINGIDFSIGTFKIPFWDKVKEFAKNIALQTPYMRLLAQDIVIDANGKMNIIEYNVDSIHWSFVMCAGIIPFADKFDEVIEYCLKHKNEIDK